MTVNGNGHVEYAPWGMRLFDMQDMVMRPEECPDVVFAIPAYLHSVSKRFLISMSQTHVALHSCGITSGFMHIDGDAFVVKARNKLVGNFLYQFPMTQNFFFLDDDVGWPPEKVIEFIRSDKEIICGAYPKKQAEIDFPVNLLTKDGKLVEDDNGLVQAILAPTGFMRIKRIVLEKLAAKSRSFRDRDADNKERWFPYIFETGVGADEYWWGEDYTFCRKVIELLDGEIWVDPNIEFYHQGLWNWKNRLSDHLQIARQKADIIHKARTAEAEEAAAQPEHIILSAQQDAALDFHIREALGDA